MGEVDKDQKVISNKQGFYDKSGEQNSKYILGIQAGVTRVDISESEIYTKNAKISNNYRPIFGIFIEKKLKARIGLSGMLSYRNFGFEASRSDNDYDYDLKIDNHFLSSQIDLHYFLSSNSLKISFFAGIELLAIVLSEEQYCRRYSSFQIRDELGFARMKDIINPFFLSAVAGISYKFNCVIPLRLFVQAEYSLLSPTRNRILKEGDYNRYLILLNL